MHRLTNQVAHIQEPSFPVDGIYQLPRYRQKPAFQHTGLVVAILTVLALIGFMLAVRPGGH